MKTRRIRTLSLKPGHRLSAAEAVALVEARHREPRSALGYHEYPQRRARPACVVRVLEPGAEAVSVHWDDEDPDDGRPLRRIHPGGLFEGRLPYRRPLTPYRLRVRYPDGHELSRHDPYYFSPQLSDFDLYLFGEGNHHRIFLKLGAHPGRVDDLDGTRFAVWAPNAERVSVVGEFNLWDGRRQAMQARGGSGVWELFIPGVGPGAAYKYEIRTRDGRTLLKSDPYGFAMQLRPGNCSMVADLGGYEWGDGEWLQSRATGAAASRPVSAYELHLSSWRKREGRHPPFMNWREAADELVPYVLDLGHTHIELMGVSEHPLDESWGYQVTGYYAPTARFGSPQDLMYFVDRCHQAGLGVIIDWVPAHFPRDESGLAGFDGTALYEHADPRLGEHMDWGTKIFNFGRHEVRNFLVANALYWLDQYHLDGLRVDAVASMLYLDYSRGPGEWVPNRHGGRENLEAIDFLRQLNGTLRHYHPGVLTIAEESTAFPGVTRPLEEGGLGFGMKWNMGWMNDTLRYFSLDPIYRRHEHHLITFSFMYAWSERFMLPLSHDEVVHGKGSLLGKMPGDEWQKRANLRTLLAYMTAHPGKKLLFMGGEFGQRHEWRDGESLDWGLLGDPGHAGLQRCLRDLNRLYRESVALYGSDWDPQGFGWLELHNAAESVWGFRRGRPGSGEPLLVCLFNATPVPRVDYRVGVESHGSYGCVFNSDAGAYGGSEHPMAPWLSTGDGVNGFPASLTLTLPPLAAVFYRQAGG
ncbi:MAG: 1,4-alpha-glucan branching protein [Proteobacteria bacterium]|nr:1,4-alpha-glucan branching protein [Pseudomonadota bacterium]